MDEKQLSFEYYRSIAPMLWVFVALATLELLVVHLFVSVKWPKAAWPLTLVTAVSVGWFIIWILSMRTRPHRLAGNSLHLNLGRLRSVEVPVDAIEQVRSSWSSGEHKGKGTANLVPIAYPNRLIDLGRPLHVRRRQVRRVAIRLDNPARFDAALLDRGIAVQ